MDSLVELTMDLKDNKIKQRSAQVLGQCLNELKNLKVLDWGEDSNIN